MVAFYIDTHVRVRVRVGFTHSLHVGVFAYTSFYTCRVHVYVMSDEAGFEGEGDLHLGLTSFLSHAFALSGVSVDGSDGLCDRYVRISAHKERCSEPRC